MVLQMARYPCPKNDPTNSNPGAWFSEFLPESNISKEVSFKVEFENISRLKNIEIEWLFLPDEIKIEYFTDSAVMVWDVVKPWYRLQAKGSKAFYKDKQSFKNMVFAKGIRIVMRGSGKERRYGIQSINVQTQDQTAMFIEKSMRKVPRCWVSAETNFNVVPRPHILMDCINALEMNDSREIYKLEEYKIKQWADDSCLGAIVIKQTPPKIDIKVLGSTSCGADASTQDYVIHDNGKFSLRSDPSLCAVAGPEVAVKNVQEFGVVSVSSSGTTANIKPYGPLVNGGADIWQTNPGDQQAFYQIAFDREYLVANLIIDWDIPNVPKLFEVLVMSEDGQWVTQKKEKPAAGAKTTTIEFKVQQVKGLKILFLEADPAQTKG